MSKLQECPVPLYFPLPDAVIATGVMPHHWDFYNLTPGDYDSFAVAILSQNHRGINIVELISARIKVIIALPRGFPDNDIIRFP